MKIYKLKDFTRGWLVGSFKGALYKVPDHEMAIKYYNQNDYERSHCHKLADELTIVIFGEVAMNGVKYVEGDLIVQEPGEYTDFHCLSERAITAVYRNGSYPNDKYFKEDEWKQDRPADCVCKGSGDVCSACLQG